MHRAFENELKRTYSLFTMYIKSIETIVAQFLWISWFIITMNLHPKQILKPTKIIFLMKRVNPQ